MKQTITSLDFQVPVKTVSELNQREHWAVKNKRKQLQQLEVMAVLNNNLRGRSVQLPCLVKLTRIGPRKLDEGDNLSSAFKGIRDQIAKQLGADDGDTDTIRFEYAQMPIGMREYGVRVTINSV
jgi:hypothetical protein